MQEDFPRRLTLLRKEKGISQRKAAEALGVSQALLSHYEKGIRECGLDFLVRCANFYGVSADYLLGRSPERDGAILTVDDLPENDSINGKDNTYRAGILPMLHKKLITNSVSVLFDLLAKSGNKALIQETSSFLMLAVYKMFRIVYSVNPKNEEKLFKVPKALSRSYSTAVMQVSEANAASIARGESVDKSVDLSIHTDLLSVTTESLARDYPMFSSSLLNLIQKAEGLITGDNKLKTE